MYLLSLSHTFLLVYVLAAPVAEILPFEIGPHLQFVSNSNCDAIMYKLQIESS